MLESEYQKTTKERFVNNVLRRENPQQDQIRPVRYLNDVTVEDDEVATNQEENELSQTKEDQIQ